ncbi:hypothetical protein evm_013861 [Chilo suppressalis]|nr:hypothetical protein evm_013861 [Chilo suppressalis]
MSRLQACRVCLAHHSRMYSILNGPLQQIYEYITEIPLVMGDIWPTCICYICYHMMRKFKKFIDKSLKANELLLQLISSECEGSDGSGSIASSASRSSPLPYDAVRKLPSVPTSASLPAAESRESLVRPRDSSLPSPSKLAVYAAARRRSAESAKDNKRGHHYRIQF